MRASVDTTNPLLWLEFIDTLDNKDNKTRKSEVNLKNLPNKHSVVCERMNFVFILNFDLVNFGEYWFANPICHKHIAARITLQPNSWTAKLNDTCRWKKWLCWIASETALVGLIFGIFHLVYRMAETGRVKHLFDSKEWIKSNGMHTLRALLCACIIGHALACFRITQNNPESLRYVEFDRVATDIKIQSDSNLIDCRK